VIYREAGTFRTTYRADQAIFPIPQDRVFIWGLLAFAFLVVPLIASDYLFLAILIPFLILALAALGLNLLVGYCGQISLGTGGFMAVGAYSAYKLATFAPELNLIIVWLFGGLCAAGIGILFGIPSLRIKGFYLAVATLAAQFASSGGPTTRPRARPTHPGSSCSAGMPTGPSRSTSSRWASPFCSRSLRRTSCAAASAARGWRSATWTSPPRSLASDR
jgi:hypothetical protein